MPIRPRHRRAVALGLACLLAAGCAVDPDIDRPFTEVPTPQLAPPSTPPAPEPLPPGAFVPPAYCPDPDPNTVTGCLDATAGVLLLPSREAILIAEAHTGRLRAAVPHTEPVEYARIPLRGGERITAITLSPTFVQDGLVFAYVASPARSRVVRVARGDAPKDLLADLPGSNGGALAMLPDRRLAIVTAGRVVTVPAAAPPGTPPTVLVEGGGTPGGACVDLKNANLWWTDTDGTNSRLRMLRPTGGAVSTVYSWPGPTDPRACVATGDTVAVALAGASRVDVLQTDSAVGSTLGNPQPLGADAHGRYTGLLLDPSGTLWASTANKPDAVRGEFDDKVVILPQSGGPLGGSDRD